MSNRTFKRFDRGMGWQTRNSVCTWGIRVQGYSENMARLPQGRTERLNFSQLIHYENPWHNRSFLTVSRPEQKLISNETRHSKSIISFLTSTASIGQFACFVCFWWKVDCRIALKESIWFQSKPSDFAPINDKFMGKIWS